MRTAHIVMVFVDGLGAGEKDPAVNPIYGGVCPCLVALLDAHAVPIDAQLDIPGLPQSATGQTTLLTGVNAARAVGRHVEGFPTPDLREILVRHSIFRQLSDRAIPSTFANAYYALDSAEVARSRFQSATTVSTLSAFGAVRTRAFLEADDAVYHDLTRQSLRPRGYTGPIIAPAQAGRHLAAIAKRHAFTLFEHFNTDRAGHKADLNEAESVLRSLNAFLETLIHEAAASETIIVLTSDHGNIEDVRTRGHTRHPVPFAVVGLRADELKAKVRSLVDVTPAIVGFLTSKEHRGQTFSACGQKDGPR